MVGTGAVSLLCVRSLQKGCFLFLFFLPHFSLTTLRAEGNVKSLCRFLLEHALRVRAGDVDAG